MQCFQVVFVIVSCLFFNVCASKKSPGHMKPLGQHSSPKGVSMIGKFSTPGVFYQRFIQPGKPLHMKSVLQLAEFPPLKEWKTQYLRNATSQEDVFVETQKKENRSKSKIKMKMDSFLKRYKKEDLYLVTSLPEPLRGDMYLPESLSCGLLQHSLMDVGLWLSSGGTASVLHRDDLDNLICVLNGTKEIVLIDKAYKSLVEATGFNENGTYSSVDVDAVDGEQFPRLLMVPWHRMFLQKGDCGFVPHRWYHQVRSFGQRSLAVNFWFAHNWWFDHEDCKNRPPDMHYPLPPYASSNEALRSSLLEPFRDLGEVNEEDLAECFSEYDPEIQKQFFKTVDKNNDRELSWSELYSFDIDEAVSRLPSLFTKLLAKQSTKVSRVSAPQQSSRKSTVSSERLQVVVEVPLGQVVTVNKGTVQAAESLIAEGDQEDLLDSKTEHPYHPGEFFSADEGDTQSDITQKKKNVSKSRAGDRDEL